MKKLIAPIMLVSLSAGCAPGAVVIDSLLKGTATGTVNASGSVSAPSAQPAQVVAPSKTASKLVVYQNFASLDPLAGKIPFINTRPQAIFSAYVKPIGGIAEFKRVRFTLIGDAKDTVINGKPVGDSFLTDVRQKFDGQVTTIPSFTNSIAEFASGDKLLVVQDGGIAELNAGALSNIDEMPVAAFIGKTIGLSIKKASDIELADPNTMVEGTFPLDGPLFTFCCT
jgi:hypothetical protein